jgi:phage tail tube protein FII
MVKMKNQTWNYLLLMAVAALATWGVIEYVKVQPLQITVNDQAKELNKFGQCKEKLAKMEKAASARSTARGIVNDNEVWSIASVDFFTRSDARDEKKRSTHNEIGSKRAR